tara:strand:+ start:607 stop:1188 length:582 start_codon:yes stop_codon:yes gene_type:complete
MVNVKNAILNSIDLKKQILNNDFLLETVEKIVDVCIKSLQNGNTIWWCGNGGSAADAQHLAAELSGRFYFDREPLASEALHVNTSYLTAVANDYSYDVIYSRYLNGCGRDGDVIIGITTSGNSKNIINAFAAAKEKNITTVGLTGDTGGKLASLSELLLNVPSKDTPRIQESHIMLGHIICELIEARIFSDET